MTAGPSHNCPNHCWAEGLFPDGAFKCQARQARNMMKLEIFRHLAMWPGWTGDAGVLLLTCAGC